MACPDSKIEGEFLGYLTDNGFNFGIREVKLRLTDDSTVLEFKKLEATG